MIEVLLFRRAEFSVAQCVRVWVCHECRRYNLSDFNDQPAEISWLDVSAYQVHYTAVDVITHY